MSTFLADTVDVLRRTPAVVSALLAGVPDAWTRTPDVADGWRPRDVVGHLISAEIDDWIPRAERILEDGTSKPFEAFDRFAHVDRDVDVPLDRLVERFAELRAHTLARLDELVADEADLDRRGRHPTLGEVTLRELLAKIPRDVTIVMIEHDMDTALDMAERVTVLHYGSVIVEGTRNEVVADPKTREVYLGE